MALIIFFSSWLHAILKKKCMIIVNWSLCLHWIFSYWVDMKKKITWYIVASIYLYYPLKIKITVQIIFVIAIFSILWFYYNSYFPPVRISCLLFAAILCSINESTRDKHPMDSVSNCLFFLLNKNISIWNWWLWNMWWRTTGTGIGHLRY